MVSDLERKAAEEKRKAAEAMDNVAALKLVVSDMQQLQERKAAEEKRKAAELLKAKQAWRKANTMTTHKAAADKETVAAAEQQVTTESLNDKHRRIVEKLRREIEAAKTVSRKNLKPQTM